MSKISLTRVDSRYDGFALPALLARAEGERRGAVIVAQEIFGLSEHVAEMCAFFAASGYDALAPGLFERIEPGFSAGLDEAGIAKGRAAVAATPWTQVVGDVQGAVGALSGPVFVAGFCYGGAVAWLAAARCAGLGAVACFYGRLIKDMIDEAPRVPALLHYGARDASIPLQDVEAVRAAHRGARVHVYDAGHGFCRRASADHDGPSAELALARTLAWFAEASR